MIRFAATICVLVALLPAILAAQDRSVQPGLNNSLRNHDMNVFVGKFEKTQLEFPIIRNFGGVLARPHAVEQPRAGVKVVFDVTADAKPGDVNKGLDRVARLLNLYGVAGKSANNIKIAIVLHGEATKSALKDADYKSRFDTAANPNLQLIRDLQKAGVEIFVCGQALNYKNFADSEVADGIPIAAAALTVAINKQADGFAYLPVP